MTPAPPDRGACSRTASKTLAFAGDQASVEQAEQELGIRRDPASSKSASSRTCWPSASRRSHSGCSTALMNASSAGTDRAVEDDQQIEVGVQAERAPAVAAERADGERQLGLALRVVEAASRTRPSIRSARRATTSRPPRPLAGLGGVLVPGGREQARRRGSSAPGRSLPGIVNVIEPVARAPSEPIAMKPWYPRGPARDAPHPRCRRRVNT